MNSNQKHSFLFWLLVVLAILAYSLPWLTNPGVSLSPGAYDLAEWTSLNSAVRGISPPLLLTFVLRLLLVCLTWIVAFAGPNDSRMWWIHALFVVVAAIAMLPPLEFFTQYFEDLNYRQQFALALGTLIGSGIALSGRLWQWHNRIILAIGLLGAALSVLGILASLGLMRDFLLPAQIGLGGIAFTVICLLLGLLQIKQTRQPLTSSRLVV